MNWRHLLPSRWRARATARAILERYPDMNHRVWWSGAIPTEVFGEALLLTGYLPDPFSEEFNR